MLHRLFNKQDVAGLEITDDFIRLAFLWTKNKKPAPPILIEATLAKGIVVGGVVQDESALAQVFIEIWDKYKDLPRYVVLSLPAQVIFSHTLYLPQSVSEQKIREAVSVFTRFQLPFPPAQAYVGHEIATLPNKQKTVLITAAARPVIDSYLAALGKAHIKPIAAEPYALSLCRATDMSKLENVLFAHHLDNRTEYTIVSGGHVAHSSVATHTANKETRKKGKKSSGTMPPDTTAERLQEFYEAETGKRISATLTIEQMVPNSAVSAFIDKEKPDPHWLTSLGSALRGFTPRSADTEASVLPLGAAEAYLYQKITTYADVLTGISIGAVALMIACFGGVLFFITSLEHQITASTASLVPPSNVSTSHEARMRITAINTFIDTAHTFLYSSIRNTDIYSRLYSLIPPGITINIMSITSGADPITLTGTAVDRPTLNAFRDTLENVPYIKNVELPLNNLNKKDDIPFALSFRIDWDAITAPN